MVGLWRKKPDQKQRSKAENIERVIRIKELLEKHPNGKIKPTPEIVTFLQKALNKMGHNVPVDGDPNSPLLLAELNGFYASIGRKDLMLSTEGGLEGKGDKA